MSAVLLITLVLLFCASRIQILIGNARASFNSRVMGLILATVATGHVLSALKLYFQTGAEKTMPKRQENTAFFYPLSGKINFGSAVQMVYIPVYSNIFKSKGASLNLAVTLSFRNTDMTRPITITSVHYKNTGGELVEE